MILGTNTSVAQGDADNFYKSNSVNTEKVSFSNQYKMKVGARLFLPKELEEGRKYPAVIVGHPMGAVKEPVSYTHLDVYKRQALGRPQHAFHEHPR